MKILYKLLRQDPNSREGVVVATSALGILVNLLLAAVKVIIGRAVASIAIVSEGINNATDCASALLTIVGTKLSNKHPTKDHPFGFGRVEYLTSLVIAGLILITGAELLICSVKLIFEPAELSINLTAILVVAGSAVVKLLLGSYTLKTGKRIGSGSLVAVGTDAKNDSVISVVTILSALSFIIFKFSVDAYAGIITSVFILKAGLDILKDTLSDLLGKSVDKELADKLYKEIRATDGVLNAADLMLHNYGPDSYSGSINIEVDHEKTIGEMYAIIHALQLKIMHEYNIVLAFGMYAVDRDHEEIGKMRAQIADFIHSHEHVNSYHALYIDPKNSDIYCDLIVDYSLMDWDALRQEFTDYMASLYPDSRLELTIETDYV